MLPLQLRHHVRLRRAAPDLQVLPGDLPEGAAAPPAAALQHPAAAPAGHGRHHQLLQAILRLHGYLQRQVVS